MPRKYPESHTNQFGQEIRVGDTVVVQPIAFPKYTPIFGLGLKIGEVISLSMHCIRVQFTYTDIHVRGEDRGKQYEATKEVTVKPPYVYKLSDGE